jgi:excisionase family DNA binding protein
MEDDVEDLLTTAELARRLKVTAKTVREWVQAGRLPCVRPSRKVMRFDWAAVRGALAGAAANPERRFDG